MSTLLWYLMYKYFGIALLGIFATMLIPMNAESSVGPSFYGIAHVTTFDAAGNPTSTQSVHNALINLGEDYVVDQLFQEGTTAVADASQIASICITEDATYANTGTTPDEAETVALFDGSDGTTLTNCQEDTTVDTTTTNGHAVIAPPAFDAATHADVGGTYTAIGICPAHASATSFAGCADAAGGSNTVLFALVDISDFTLAASESATITYTFDVDE